MTSTNKKLKLLNNILGYNRVDCVETSKILTKSIEQ